MLSLIRRYAAIVTGLLAVAAVVVLAVVLLSGRAGNPDSLDRAGADTRVGAAGSAQPGATSTTTAVSTPDNVIDPAGPGPVYTEEPVYATLQARSRAHPAPKIPATPPPNVITAAEMTAVKRGAGIYPADADEMYHRSPLIEVENIWVDVVDGRRVQVTAGYRDDDPSQGVIIVLSDDLDGTDGESAVYYTPTRSGAVKVTAAAVPRITLKAADGTVFTFDVISRTFARR